MQNNYPYEWKNLIYSYSNPQHIDYSFYDWSKDIWIPIIGAVAIPLLVWGLTKHYGVDEAEKRKALRTAACSLNYLKSISYYTIINLLTLYQAIKIRYGICCKFETASLEERTTLFAHIVIQDIYSQIDIEKYANFTLHYPSFILNALQAKRSLTDIFETISLLNTSIKEISEINDLPAQLIALKNNLPILLSKIAFSIDKLLLLLHDTEKVTEILKISNIVEIRLSNEEKRRIDTIYEDLLNNFNNSDRTNKENK